MYTPRFFTWDELVPQGYESHGAILIDERVLVTLDQLRDQFGPVTVNNWSKGGPYSLRGWRPFDCREGAQFSQHKFGRAMDCSFRDSSADDVRKFVLGNPNLFPHINAIEDNVSWFHFDVRNCKRISIFRQ